MTETSETAETRDTAQPLPLDSTPGLEPIARCACGVRAGRAHYCAERDHNWVKAPEPGELDPAN